MGKKVLVCLLAVVSFAASSVFAVPRSVEVSLSPSSLAFGSVTVNTNSAAQTMVITNESSRTREILSVKSGLSEFVVTGPATPFSLAAHATASFSVVFLPNAASSYSGSIAVAIRYWDGDEVTISAPVSGTGKSAAPAPTYLLSSSTSSLSFANTLVGSSASQSVTVTNTGTGAVTVSSAAISGSEFAVSGLSGSVSLAAGSSLSLSVSFAPTAVGSVTGSLTVVSTATNSPATIALSGAGVQPAISVTPSSVSFSNVSVGVTNTQTITIKNTGTANLTVSAASLPGSTFTMSGLTIPLTLAPGASSGFSVNFTPASASTFYANLSLTNNSPTSPVVVALSGSSVAPMLTLSASPTSLSFGSVTTNSSTSQTVTVTNTGNASVSISGIAASGTGFSTSGITLPITLAAGQSTSFSVVFDPTSTGSLTGSVVVTSNASNSPLSVALSGTGTAPTTYSVSLTWTPGSSASGFNLYRGTQSGGPYTKLNNSELSTASYTDSSVTAGQTYYYVATDLNSSGQESTYSNQVTAAIP
ncbi:MAG TPA: choice-of-anchor D domain-containing protein [Candidatus Sulfotelmatobacter sp.]|nr:choice-of-anchor D domain-containing protein [Candidatus Sulfotelmatobacter sp.]